MNVSLLVKSTPRYILTCVRISAYEPRIVRYNFCLQLFVLSCSEEFSVIMASDINDSEKFESRRELSPKLTYKHQHRINVRAVSCKHIMVVLSWKQNGVSIKLQR